MPKTKVLINNLDVSELVSNLNTSIEFEKDYLIGNTPSKELKLQANNKNGEFNNLLDSPFVLQRENGNKLGTFYVVEKPERMTGELELVLYDSMHKANVEYVSFLEYPTSIKNILDEMSRILGIAIDYSLMPKFALDRVVNTYDSSEMIRSYLCWIAELGAGNFFSDTNGNYVFKPLSKTKTYDLHPDDVEQFETIEDYFLSGVYLNNGLVDILVGNDTDNVYKIDVNNPYISLQEDLENIYTLLGGLSFRSSNALKCSHIESLQLGEIINVADEFIILPMSINQTYLNAAYDIQEISGEVTNKNKSKINSTPSITKQLRKVEARVNTQDNTISLIAKSVKEYDESIAQIKLSNEKITSEVSKKVGEDEIISKINQSAEEIKIEAEKIKLEGTITANGNIKIHEDGSIEVKNGKFTGDVEGSSFFTTKTTVITYTESDKTIVQNLIINEDKPTQAQLDRYDINQDGLITSKDYARMVNILNGTYGNTGGKATFVDNIKINVGGSGKIVTERYLNGTEIEYMETNAGSINKKGDGSIIINGEPVITSISGTIARFG